MRRRAESQKPMYEASERKLIGERQPAIAFQLVPSRSRSSMSKSSPKTRLAAPRRRHKTFHGFGICLARTHHLPPLIHDSASARTPIFIFVVIANL